MVKKQLSDEQIDALMRTLVENTAAEEALVSEIADSPAIWWGVQRKINEQKPVKLLAWPPVGKVLRWLMVGVPVTAAAVLTMSFFVFRQARNNTNNGGDVVAGISQTTVTQISRESLKSNDETIPAITKGSEIPARALTKPANDVKRPVMRKLVAETRTLVRRNTDRTAIAAKDSKKEEIKTDFIALSYARDPDSGLIVRVKVPISMMVSLGLVTSVKSPSEMIDAEVLVGDDGLSRAIRFIR